MALFQPAVLKKYISGINEQEIEEVWGRFTAHFHNPEIQENIRGSKEEEYQDGFLDELKKKKVKFSLKEEAEWMEYFNEQKAKADERKSQIAQTDREIDEMVYVLYVLSEER